MMNSGLSRSSRNNTDPASKVPSSRGWGLSVTSADALARRSHPSNHAVQQAVGGLPGDFGLGSQQQPMTEGGTQQALDVVRNDVVAALERRRSLRRQQQQHLGARAGAQHQLGGLPSGGGQLDDVPTKPLVNGHLAGFFAALIDGRRVEDRFHPGARRVTQLDPGIPAAEYLELLLGRRIIDDRLEEETVL